MSSSTEQTYAAPFPLFQLWRQRGRILSILLPVICVLPLVVGLLQRVVRGRLALNDFRIMVCAAEHHAQGQSIYSPDVSLACSPDGYTFPYPPLFLDLLTGLLRMVGVGPLWVGFVALYLIAIAFIIFLTLTFGLKQRSLDAAANRAPLLAVWTGAPIAWGNLGLPLHALFLACATVVAKRPLLFVLAAAAISIVKPQLVVYATVLVFAIRPFWRGALYAVLAGLLAAALLAYNIIGQTPDNLAAWRGSLSEVANTGTGAFSWLPALGIDPLGYPALAAAVVLAGLLVLSGLAIARGGALDAQSSAMLGLSIVTIALPRLNDYDLLTIGPGLIALLAAVHAVSPRLFGLVSAVLLAALLQPIVLEWLDLGYFAAHLRHLVLVVTVLALGAYFAVRALRARGAPKDQPSHA